MWLPCWKSYVNIVMFVYIKHLTRIDKETGTVFIFHATGSQWLPVISMQGFTKRQLSKSKHIFISARPEPHLDFYMFASSCA